MPGVKYPQLSPSSLDLFLDCPHCFWLDRTLGIKRPMPYPYELNLAVDGLLRDEFDAYRKRKQSHPLLEKRKVKAKLFANQRLINQWRDAKRGLRYYDEDLKAVLIGAPDDAVKFPDGSVSPLDYKSTGKKIAKEYDRFQLQLDVYVFLLEKNGYSVNGKAYLAFHVVDGGKGFVDRLPFAKDLVEIKTDAEEVYDIFKDAVRLLRQTSPPKHSRDCQYGKWLDKARNFVH